MGMGFKLQMGMGMKSLKWEGIGMKNLFPHTSSVNSLPKTVTRQRRGCGLNSGPPAPECSMHANHSTTEPP